MIAFARVEVAPSISEKTSSSWPPDFRFEVAIGTMYSERRRPLTISPVGFPASSNAQYREGISNGELRIGLSSFIVLSANTFCSGAFREAGRWKPQLAEPQGRAPQSSWPCYLIPLRQIKRTWTLMSSPTRSMLSATGTPRPPVSTATGRSCLAAATGSPRASRPKPDSRLSPSGSSSDSSHCSWPVVTGGPLHHRESALVAAASLSVAYRVLTILKIEVSISKNGPGGPS